MRESNPSYMEKIREKEVKKMMYGIYKKSAGLQFTGVVAKTEEDARRYLGNKYGSIMPVFTGTWDENGYAVYENRFVPWYREDLFEILEVEVAE